MVKKLWKITLLLSVIIMVALSIAYFLINNLVFKLKGDNNITLNLYDNYIDSGFVASIFNLDINDKVEVTGNLNTNMVGEYNIKYKLSFLGYDICLNRLIRVVDNVSPSIKLNGNDEIKMYIGDEYVEYGALAYDNYDNDISDKIKINSNLDVNKEGNYQVVYSVIDSSFNENMVTRNVIVKQNSIVKNIEDNNYNVSIGYYNLVTGKEFLYNEDKIYYGASLIKTLDAIYLYDNNMVNDDIKPYIKKAITVSDNDSHHYLVRYIGKSKLKEYGIGLGAINTLSGWDSYGNTTVNDQIIYLKKLYSLSKENDELKSYFVNNYANYLKFNKLTTMHKYGYHKKYYHDVGIVFDDEPYIVVILTKHGDDNTRKIVNDLSKLIYRYHKNEL